jgi:hypothetical protein
MGPAGAPIGANAWPLVLPTLEGADTGGAAAAPPGRTAMGRMTGGAAAAEAGEGDDDKAGGVPPAFWRLESPIAKLTRRATNHHVISLINALYRTIEPRCFI